MVFQVLVLNFFFVPRRRAGYAGHGVFFWFVFFHVEENEQIVTLELAGPLSVFNKD
jgi:hypothetical protein